MKCFACAFLCLIPLLSISSVQANGVAVQVERVKFRLPLDGVDYEFDISRLDLALQIKKGIYLSLSSTLSDADDTANAYTVRLNRQSALLMRFVSPEDFGMKAFVELGGAQLTWEGQGALNGISSDTVNGLQLGLGLIAPFSRDGRHQAMLGYQRIDNGEEFETSSWNFGYRYEWEP